MNGLTPKHMEAIAVAYECDAHIDFLVVVSQKPKGYYATELLKAYSRSTLNNNGAGLSWAALELFKNGATNAAYRAADPQNKRDLVDVFWEDKFKF